MERSRPRRALGSVVNVLDGDPDLALNLSAGRLRDARGAAEAPMEVADPGTWLPGDQMTTDGKGLGLLVLDGALARSIRVGARQGLEVFGPGDLVCPGEPVEEPPAMVRAEVGWQALARTRLAVLDASFTSRMCAYPEVIEQLYARLERRSSTHALRLAIVQQPRLSMRVQLLLWHLADRFGRVHSEGVVLPLPLSHELLAQLLGAQRPSVSRTLVKLERDGVVARRPDGSWWLGGEPPV